MLARISPELSASIDAYCLNGISSYMPAIGGVFMLAITMPRLLMRIDPLPGVAYGARLP